MSGTFAIAPTGAFSLREAIGFGFGPRDAGSGDAMRLAFACDGTWAPCGVVVAQGTDGEVTGSFWGDVEVDVVRAQVARILSLDGDGDAFAALDDPVVDGLRTRFPGLRPVLFHSPYEAAAWAILSARRGRAQAVRVRDALCERLGTRFVLGGEPLWAFPGPAALLDGIEGEGDERSARLRGVAAAAVEGRLDASRLLSLGPEGAFASVGELRGLGTFYASLVVIRATGFHDALPEGEPRLLRAVERFYGPDADLAVVSEAWRPFRTWASVLLRVAYDRE